eukprot:557472-Rhodomonas_salina.2
MSALLLGLQVVGKELYCANAGDSRAVLCRAAKGVPVCPTLLVLCRFSLVFCVFALARPHIHYLCLFPSPALPLSRSLLPLPPSRSSALNTDAES